MSPSLGVCGMSLMAPACPPRVMAFGGVHKVDGARLPGDSFCSRRAVVGKPLGVEHLSRHRLVDIRADESAHRKGEVLVFGLAPLGALLREPLLVDDACEQLGIVAVGATG